MPSKCTCEISLDHCKIHELCQCKSIKKIVSNFCRTCYIKNSIHKRDSSAFICSCGQKKHFSSTQCLNCREHKRTEQMIHNTNPIKLYKYGNSTDPNCWTKIRQHANRIAQFYNLKQNGCCICSFPYVDICHIKSISEFDEETPINIVNDPSNLIILCKNCHWLFDHGYPSIDLIKKFYQLLKD